MVLIIAKTKTESITIISFLLLTISATVLKSLAVKGKLMQNEKIISGQFFGIVHENKKTKPLGLHLPRGCEKETGSQGFHGDPAN